MNLGNVTSLLSSGVQFLGAVLLVMGLVNLGLTIKDGMQGGGGQLAGAIAMIVGGGIVIAAGTYFGSIDTSCRVPMRLGKLPLPDGMNIANMKLSAKPNRRLLKLQ